MRKLLIVVLCTVVLLFCLSVPCLAQEAEIPTNEGNVATEVVNGSHTMFTRLWEFAVEHKEALFMTVGNLVIVFILMIIIQKNKKMSNEIPKLLDELENIISTQSDEIAAINNLIDAYNKMSDECEKMQRACETYGKNEIDRDKVVGALATEASTVLEMLSVVYSNSKNLPQGVKDLLNLKYARCLKALDDDSALVSLLKTDENGTDTTSISITEV